MTRTLFGWAGLLALGLFAGLLSPVATAESRAADATGTWKRTVERNGRTFETTLKLKQEGEKLTGTISGRQGRETEIEEGKVEGDKVSFQVTRTFNDNKFVLKYHGILEGDTIKGQVEFQNREGETQSRDWEVKRSE